MSNALSQCFSALARCAILLIVASCAGGQPRDLSAEEQASVRCAAAKTIDCQIKVATFCDAGDPRCPEYQECLALAQDIALGKVCPRP